MKLFIASLFVCATCCVAGAQEKRSYVWPVKLQKDYTKTYPVGSATVVLKNRYGKLVIETWDKNEVTVDAHISVGAETNEYAAQVLDRINVRDEKKGDDINFVTQIEDFNNNGNSNNGHEMRIDMVVHLPAKAKLYAENSFGPINLGDFAGECELVDKYGTLTAGKLLNCKFLTVEFGKVNIESLQNTQAVFKYSRVDIAKIGGAIKGQFEFCNSVDLTIDNTIQQIDLRNNYTSLYLLLPKDISADYDITTNNAKLSSKYLPMNEEKSATLASNNIFSSNHRYSGSLGKGGNTKINIKSNFGNIRFM